MNKKIVALYSCVFFIFAGNIANARCVRRSKPACAPNPAVYSNKDAYKICQAEIEAFHKVALGYIDCLKNELEVVALDIQQKIDAVSDETNSVIKEFNCKSGMHEDC